MEPNPSEWVVTQVIYNGQLFYEVEDLIQRYTEGSIRKIMPNIDLIDAKFSSYARRGHESFNTPLRGPKLMEPEGHRYTVDDQFVTYFGWSFNFNMKTSTGLQMFDIYFQNERVAYEISLQDITVFYTGDTPETSWMALYGVSWLLGASSYELFPGVDCPSTATFIDAHHFVNTGRPLRYKNCICIFEQNTGVPLRRHYSRDSRGQFDNYGGIVSNHLVVRTIVSLWSSDYIIDYLLNLDGSIQLKTYVTGYVQASYDLAGQRRYGNRLYENVRGNLHQNLFHWKIDLDIEQTSNRYQTLELSTESITDFWIQDKNVTKTQLMVEPVLQVEECFTTPTSNSELPRKHIIYNHKADNRFEAHRGYEVVNNAETTFLLDSAPIASAARWAKYPVIIFFIVIFIRIFFYHLLYII